MTTTTAATNPLEVEQWLRLAKQSDEAAARELIDYLRPRVERIIGARVGNCFSKEDICQEVFRKVFSRLDQYRGQVPLLNWVSRITANTCITAARSRQTRSLVLGMADLNEPSEQTLELPHGDRPCITDGIHARELVNLLLGSLPPMERRIIELFCLEGHSYLELKHLTGLTVGLAKTRICRIRKKLEKKLKELTSIPLATLATHETNTPRPAL